MCFYMVFPAAFHRIGGVKTREAIMVKTRYLKVKKGYGRSKNMDRRDHCIA